MMREMQRSSGSRSRSRDRGSNHLKKNMEVSSFDTPPDFYSMSPELSRNSSKKSIGVPIKSLIEEEFSTNNKKTRHPSPGVIARLMGLDSLPSLPSPNPNSQILAHASSSHEKHIFTQDELPEFKDVFEITEARKLKKKLQKNPDLDFIRKKFSEAKRLSTNQNLRSSREFNDAIEALESNKDILIEFLNKPNSLFAKHLEDLTISPPDSPPRGASQITILKPSKRGANLEIPKYERDGELNLEKYEREREINLEIPKYEKGRNLNLRDLNYNNRKNGSNISNNSFEDDYVSLTFEKPIKSKNKGKVEKNKNNKSSNIVVLKPSLDKARNTNGVGVFPVFHPENNSNNNILIPSREKSSREIAREVTKQMRRTINANSVINTKPVSLFDPNPLYDSNNNNNNNNNDDDDDDDDKSLYDEWNYYTSPKMNPIESLVNKEAKKRLSDRWKNTHNNSDDFAPFVIGTNTLSEIISKEKLHKDSKVILDNNNHNNNVSNYRSLNRSKSLPPKLGHKSGHYRRRGSRVSEFGIIKDVLDVGPKGINVISHSQKGQKSEKSHESEMEREIHVNSEELNKDGFVINNNEEKNEQVGPTFINESISFEDDADVAELVPKDDDVADLQIMENQICIKEGDEQPSPNSVQELPVNQIEEKDEIGNKDEIEEKDKMGEKDKMEENDDIEDEASTSGCFEQISADLQELRMQLRMLKMGGSGETLNEDEEQNNNLLSLSDEEEENKNETTFSLQSGERNYMQRFRDEEERDFSYLLDMLLNLGFHVLNRDDLINSCYSLDSPVGPIVFSKLERKYGDLVLWPRFERKLLFDLINSVLSEIIGSWADLKRSWAFGPKWNREEFVEGVWDKLVSKKRDIEFGNDEFVIEWKWSKDELIGREIECILHGDLLDELVSELIC